MAISLEGYISTKNGSFNWIRGDKNKSNNTKKQFNFELDEIKE